MSDTSRWSYTNICYIRNDSMSFFSSSGEAKVRVAAAAERRSVFQEGQKNLSGCVLSNMVERGTRYGNELMRHPR